MKFLSVTRVYNTDTFLSDPYQSGRVILAYAAIDGDGRVLAGLVNRYPCSYSRQCFVQVGLSEHLHSRTPHWRTWIESRQKKVELRHNVILLADHIKNALWNVADGAPQVRNQTDKPRIQVLSGRVWALRML